MDARFREHDGWMGRARTTAGFFRTPATAGYSSGDMAAGLFEDVWKEVAPARIRRLDQLELPRPVPLLELCFAANGRREVRMQLEPCEEHDAVLLRESIVQALAMFVNALAKPPGHTDIKRAAFATRHDIDGRMFR